jgi:hypothetical protein
MSSSSHFDRPYSPSAIATREAAGTVTPIRMARSMNIYSESFNILGLMPHPENLIDPLVGGTDGWGLLESLARDAKVA